MSKKEFKLSEKEIAIDDDLGLMIKSSDIKEFIKRLKDKLIRRQEYFCQHRRGEFYYFDEDKLKEIIDKLVGEDLK